MKKGIIVVIFIYSLYFQLNSQNIGTANIVGSTLSIQSEIMGDERTLQIYLPDGYAASEQEYPILYILDGQRYFLHAVSLQQSFKEFKQTPDFIIIGISKKASDRNRNFSTNAKTYLEFIKKEVIKNVESQLRTTGERLLFGWAFGGGFSLETMVSEPNLFDAYIAASPFPIENKISKIDSLMTNVPNLNKLLFFTSGINEGLVKSGTHQLNDLLTEKAKPSLNWTFIEFEEEEHRSTPFTTLYHGVRKYFHYYPELQFNNLEEFVSAGGLEYTYDYYKKRSERYGFPEKLSDWTMFSIVRNAIRAEDYVQFNLLVDQFNNTNFISRLRVSRACSIAAFYLKNDQYEKAKKMYTLIAETNPDSVMPLSGLGDTYSELGDEKMANSFYKKAEALEE